MQSKLLDEVRLVLRMGRASETQAPAPAGSASNHPVPALTGDLNPTIEEEAQSALPTGAEPTPTKESPPTSTKATNPQTSATAIDPTPPQNNPQLPPLDRTLPPPLDQSTSLWQTQTSLPEIGQTLPLNQEAALHPQTRIPPQSQGVCPPPLTLS